MTPPFSRREFAFAGTAAALLAALPHSPLHAQSFELPSSEPPALIPFATQPRLWDQVAVDVHFIDSWRLEVRPMGYEGEGNFEGALAQSRADIFNSRSRLPSQLAAEAQRLTSERQRFLSALSDSRSRFNTFLAQIGVAPEGPAGQRMLRSMFVFANFALVTLSADAFANGRNRSYWWPFC
jgi:hypothetical protein